MKKVLFTIVIIITLHITLYAQLQSVGIFRIANTTTAFGRVIPQGTILIDKATGDGYLLVSNATATESISSLVIGSNYRKLLSYNTADNKIPGLDADFLDSHDASYFQVAGSYDNYLSWIVKDDLGTAISITKGFPLSIKGGGLINTLYDPVNKSIQISTTANNYSLPIAGASTLGGIKIGSRISIASGVISADVQSDYNFTSAYKTKLDGITAGAEINVNPDWNATSGDAMILNKPTTIAGYGITDANTNQTFVIKDSGGTTQWTIAIDNTTKVLQFKNASGVIKMTLDQSGNLKVAGDVQAFTTF